MVKMSVPTVFFCADVFISLISFCRECLFYQTSKFLKTPDCKSSRVGVVKKHFSASYFDVFCLF